MRKLSIVWKYKDYYGCPHLSQNIHRKREENEREFQLLINWIIPSLPTTKVTAEKKRMAQSLLSQSQCLIVASLWFTTLQVNGSSSKSARDPINNLMLMLLGTRQSKRSISLRFDSKDRNFLFLCIHLIQYFSYFPFLCSE